MQSLTGRVLRGLMVVTATQWLVRVLVVSQHIVLARVFTIEEYGVAAIGLLLLMLQGTLRSLGFQSSLIQQRDEPTRLELDVAWTLDSVAARWTAAALIAASGPLLATFFGVPIVSRLALVASLVSVVGSLENNATVILLRQLEYRRRSLLGLAESLGTVSATIVFTLLWRDPFAVVWGAVVGRTLRSLYSHVLVSERPRLRWDGRIVRRQARFAAWVFLDSLLTRVRGHIDKFFVGRLLGMEMLGVFQVASRFSIQLQRDLLDGVTQSLFPAVSKVSDQQARVARASFLAIEASSLMAAVGAGILFAFAPAIVRIVLGEKWLIAVPAIYWSCAATIFVAIAETTAPLFRGLGKPRLEVMTQAASLVVLVVAIVPLSREFGIIGAVAAVLSGEIARALISFLLLGALTAIPPWRFAWSALKPVALTSAPLLLLPYALARSGVTGWPVVPLVGGALLLTLVAAWRLRWLESLDLLHAQFFGRVASRLRADRLPRIHPAEARMTKGFEKS